MRKHLWTRLVHAAFDRLYTTFAGVYDYVAWAVSRGDWQAWGRGALGHLAPGPVLELGCGTGHLLAHLAARAPVAVGVDRSPAMLAQAATRRGGAGLVQARAEALPFAAGVFGTVVSTFPAPYIARAATLDELERVLMATGRLVVVDDAELVDRDVYTAAVNLAYRLTSRPIEASPLPGRLRERRFRLTRFRHDTRRGRVTVVVAERAASDGGSS